MEKKRILYVMEEITPYLPESPISKIGRFLPQKTQESRKEIRTFMPRFGLINERRNQLHEVIRLSGMNLIIDEIDHPLIIKVASIQQARMQVYFIDNEDFFKRKFVFRDKKDKFFDDNDERTIFFSKGVLETVKKLGWAPDLVHCHGWFSSMIPLYLRTTYKDNPLFSNLKIVFSLYNDDFNESFKKEFVEKMKSPEMNDADTKYFIDANFISLNKSAIDNSDAIIMGSNNVNSELLDYAKASGKPILEYEERDDYHISYNEFYDNIIGEE